MQRKRLSRSSKKLGRKNYIKANMKKIRDIQSKAKQPDEKSIQRNVSHIQKLKSVKSTTKKCSKKDINEANGRTTGLLNALSTRSQLTLLNDNAVSLCLKKFIENIKVSKDMCDTVSRNKSPYSITDSVESGSSTSLDSSSSQENNHSNFGKSTTRRDVGPHRLQTSNKKCILNKTLKPMKNVPPKEFEIVKEIYCKPNYSKAYKNEGCQTVEESTESISSTELFRYPSNGKSVETHATTEQSSQTDIKPKTDVVNARTKIPNNTLKNDRRTEAIRNYQVNKNLKFQKNSVMSKHPSSIGATNAKPIIDKQRRMDTKNIIRNTNQIQSTVAASCIEDFEKMCEEIQKANKISPFARHQTEFQQNDTEKIKDKGTGNKTMKIRDCNRPRGTIGLPEHKRNEYLAQIMIRRRNLLKDLNSIFDDNTKTEAHQNIMNYQENLKSMDHALEVLSQNNLYIDLGNH